MTTDDKPAPRYPDTSDWDRREAAGHPPPWKWKRSGRCWLLMDGVDICVLALNDDERGEQPKSLRTPTALIAAAPEMEALLRNIADEAKARFETPSPTQEAFARAAQAIIDRIDAAKAAA